MLSIGKLGRGQERYYLDKVAAGAEDYYAGEGEAQGYWLGDAAHDLLLEGEVGPDQLTAMLRGDNPANGEPLGLRHVEGGPVPGFDLTFSAPKSVSLTWAIGGPPAGAEVKAAHAASVEAALAYLQAVACWTRRGAGGHEFVPGNGFLAAAYVHRSSRAGDPQLHTHVLVANATRGPDGRWTRLYHPAIYEHAKTAGYIYEAHLRDELTRRLGVRWAEIRNGIAEIEGFEPEQLRAFSTRRAEILEAAGGEGASARAMQIATLTTREAKTRDLTTESLRELWRSKGRELGLDREAIRSTLGHGRQSPQGRVAVAAIEGVLTAHASHFDRRAVIQAVAECLPAGAPGADVIELADAYLATPDVIRIAETPKGEVFTTREIWELERGALAGADRMAASGERAGVEEIVVARVLAQRPTMKPDQRAMVERLLGRGEGLVVVIGEAGSGKTYALGAAAQGWAAAGVELRVAAPTWRAAHVLRSEGLEATTVAGLLARLDRAATSGERALASGSVLVVDEAGMVDSRALARLIAHAETAEAKLVLVGDPAQLGEIEAGGLFASIASRGEPIVLDEVIRHRGELEREGAKLIRAGEGSEALALYEGAERVTVADDPAQRREAMVADWWQRFGEGEEALMIAKRNAEVRELNALARQRMRAEGRLGSEEIEVGGERFAAGDQIITRVNDHAAQIYNRQRWTVTEVDAASGRLVLDGIDTARRVGVDSVFLERVNPRDGAAAIEHAYAATIYQAQGATLESAFVMADPSMTKQEFYVATSRSRGETHLYVTPESQLACEEIAPRSPYLRGGLAHIAEAAERDGSQAAAHDAALRSRLGELSSPQLARLRDELRSETDREEARDERREALEQRIAKSEARLERFAVERAELGERPRRPREARRAYDESLRQIDSTERFSRQGVEELRAELRTLPAVEHEARAELAVIEHVLAERQRLALVAARISPPDYLTRELGERPSDPTKAATWDRGVREIEGYRQQHGIRDRDNALGPKPQERAREREQQLTRQRLERTQKKLGLQRAHGKERTIDLGIFR